MTEQKDFQSKIKDDMLLCDFLVELMNNDLLSHQMYEIFITEERSYGEVPFEINNGRFEFPFMDCSEYDENMSMSPVTKEEEMYINIYHLVNSILDGRIK